MNVKKKINIAVVVGSFPQISETFILNHIISLLDVGYNVTIFATSINRSSVQHNVVNKYKLINLVEERINPHIGFKRYFKIINYFFKYKKYFLTLLKTFNPKFYGISALKGYFFFEALPFLSYSPTHFDIVHAHFGENGNKISYLKQIGIIKSTLIVSFHGHDVNHKNLVYKQNNYKALLKHSDALIFNSKYLLQKFKANIGNHRYTYQIPVGINPNLFTTKKNKVVKSKVKFITVARLVDCKGIELVLKSLRAINKDRFEYNIIGDGPNKKRLLNLSEQYELTKNVNFLGRLSHNDVVTSLKNNDVFILFGTTDKNGEIDAQGLVVQEAQACGLPSIVSTGGGLPEGVIHKHTGFILQENNINELSNIISYFISNPNIISIMGKNATEFSHKNYNQKEINKRIINIYKKFL